MPYLVKRSRSRTARLSGSCPPGCALDFRDQCIPSSLYDSVNYDIAKEHFILESDANDMARLQSELDAGPNAMRHDAIVMNMSYIRTNMARSYARLEELYQRSTLESGVVPDYDEMVASAGGTCAPLPAGKGGIVFQPGLNLDPFGAGGAGGAGDGAGGGGAPSEARPAWHYAVGVGVAALAWYLTR